MSIGIVLCFFSGCPAELPKKHAVRTIEFACSTGVPVAFTQVVRSGEEPLPVPKGVATKSFRSDEYIFFKENLWNIGARLLNVDKFIFLDSDVYFKDPSWLDRAAGKLSEVDFMQPFEFCHWLDKKGGDQLIRPSSCSGLANGVHPKGGVYHPGFCLGVTRNAFDALGGLWEGAVCGGGGDGANILAHSRSVGTDKYLERLYNKKIFKGMLMEDHRRFFHSPSWHKYRAKSKELGITTGYVENQHVYHLWHGDRKKRKYTTRAEYFNWPNPDPPVRHRPDGLQEFTCPQPKAKEYFFSRDEDGRADAKGPGDLAPNKKTSNPWYYRLVNRK
jgi:hypothetical protein